MNFQRDPFDLLIMRSGEIKARDIRVSYLKMGRVVKIRTVKELHNL